MSLFCIVPECDERFGAPDALTKHVRAVHDLHPLKIDESSRELMDMVDEDSDLRTPWWYSPKWVQLLTADDSVSTVGNLYHIPLDFKSHKVAQKRYKAYVHDKNPHLELVSPVDANSKIVNVVKLLKRYEKEKEKERLRKANQPMVPELEVLDDSPELIAASLEVHSKLSQETAALKSAYVDLHAENIDQISDVEQLAALHDNLQARLNTASRINKIVSAELASKTKEKRRLWLINQLLLDSNVNIGLPPVPGLEALRVMMDDLDDLLLS